MGQLTFKIKKLSLGIAILSVFMQGIGLSSPVLAQSGELPSDPLERPLADPLIPAIERPLSPFEQRLLREALDQLNAEAKAQLAQGNADAAWEIWYRELRLRRKLGRMEEIQALGRVGAIAWENNRTPDIQIIIKRLTLIQQQAQTEGELTPELLTAFAQAYEQLRDINHSLVIYQQILQNARQAGDVKTEEMALEELGRLYLAKFDYPNAAEIYETLLDRAQAKGDNYRGGIYLQKLAEIYTQALQPENAIKIKDELVQSYLDNQNLTAIPDLKISIGNDYKALTRAEQASQSYQEAFSLAWALQQFGAAGVALKQLGDLYEENAQDAFALQIYQELVKVEQASYNYYGLMSAYDKMGQIYLRNGQHDPALIAFQQALEIANSLSFKQDYFLNKIQEVNLQKQGINPQP